MSKKVYQCYSYPYGNLGKNRINPKLWYSLDMLKKELVDIKIKLKKEKDELNKSIMRRKIISFDFIIEYIEKNEEKKRK